MIASRSDYDCRLLHLRTGIRAVNDRANPTTEHEWIYHGDSVDTVLAVTMAAALLAHGRDVMIRIEDLSPQDTGQTIPNYTVWEREGS